MFFSPNKFIFHSHRITTNDRYVQPDAANFNSWRRHMTLLNGNSTNDEKIIHAWEDVKAMFNGGTRKRLVGSSSSSNNNNRNQNSSPSSPLSSGVIGGNTSCNSPRPTLNFERDTKKTLSTEEESRCPILENQYKYSTVAAATAAVVATVGVPFNFDASNASLSGDHLSLMPISRNFVVDYMWQQKDHQHYEQQYSKKEESNLETLELESNYPKSWGKPEANVMGNSLRLSDNITTHKNRKLTAVGGGTSLADYKIPSILSCSAFKPVVASTAIVSTSLYTRSSDLNRNNDNINSSQATRTTTVLTHNTSHRIVNHDLAFSPISDKESK